MAQDDGPAWQDRLHEPALFKGTISEDWPRGGGPEAVALLLADQGQRRPRHARHPSQVRGGDEHLAGHQAAPACGQAVSKQMVLVLGAGPEL